MSNNVETKDIGLFGYYILLPLNFMVNTLWKIYDNIEGESYDHYNLV